MPLKTNYAVHLKEFVEEWMEENDLTPEKISADTGMSLSEVNALLEPTAPIDADHAVSLERLTSIPAKMWSGIDALYWADMKRLGRL